MHLNHNWARIIAVFKLGVSLTYLIACENSSVLVLVCPHKQVSAGTNRCLRAQTGVCGHKQVPAARWHRLLMHI